MLKNSGMVSYCILISIFIISPFYYQPNIGGLGLVLPANQSVWLFAISFMFVMVLVTMARTYFRYTNLFSYCLIFPAILLFMGLISRDNPQPIVWLFRELYLLGGILFLFLLFQLKLSSLKVEQVLYAISASTLVHSLIGFMQIHSFDYFSQLGLMAMSRVNLPIGIFQQVNLQAIYLVTGIQISLYLMSRPSFNSARYLTKVLLVLTISLSVYVVLSTGSRAGVLSLIIATSVLVISRFKQLIRCKGDIALMSMFVFVAIVSLQTEMGSSRLQDKAGTSRLQEKVEKITAGEYQTIRSTMYATTIDAIKEKPLVGYGIGSFPSVWAEQAIIFAKDHSQANTSQNMTNHPHNEIMLWMLEGGVAALIGILFIIGAIFLGLYRCGFSRGGAYAALLFPISFHTQVELPFYGSAIHWFLWIFLIYIVFRHQLKPRPLKLTPGMKNIIRLLSAIAAGIAILFLVHAAKAQKEIYDYKHRGKGELVGSLQNPYFNSHARRMLMQDMLYVAIEQKSLPAISSFIAWAENEIKGYPAQALFVMLSDAYGAMNNANKQCEIGRKGQSLYTNDKYLINVVNKCESLKVQ